MTPRGGRPSAESPTTRVVAVFHHRAYAESVAQELERRGLGSSVSIEDRRMTDDPPADDPAPGVEATDRRRDKEVAGHVFRNVVTLSAAYALAGAVLGGLIGTVVDGFGDTWFWVALAVGAVTGTVLGGIQGGIGAAMSESEREEGTLLIVEVGSDDDARRAEELIREHQPQRVDVERGGRLAG